MQRRYTPAKINSDNRVRLIALLQIWESNDLISRERRKDKNHGDDDGADMVATTKQMVMMVVLVVHVEVIEAMWHRFMCSSYKKQKFERERERERERNMKKKNYVRMFDFRVDTDYFLNTMIIKIFSTGFASYIRGQYDILHKRHMLQWNNRGYNILVIDWIIFFGGYTTQFPCIIYAWWHWPEMNKISMCIYRWVMHIDGLSCQ